MDRDELVSILDKFFEKYSLGVSWAAGGSVGIRTASTRPDLVEELAQEIENVYERTVGNGLSEEPGEQQPVQGNYRIRSRVDKG